MRNLLERFERQHEKLLSSRRFAARMVRFVVLAIIIEVAVIMAGSLGFRYIEGLNWLDSALNATMVITGNGPAFEPQTEWAKVFQIIFSLSGVIVFVLVLTVMAAPVVHRILHRFHMDPDDIQAKTKRG